MNHNVAISRRAAAKPSSNAAIEDALNGAHVTVFQDMANSQKLKVKFGTFSQPRCLPGPGEKHTKKLKAGDFLHFSSVNM